jgi:hypothetical protein
LSRSFAAARVAVRSRRSASGVGRSLRAARAVGGRLFEVGRDRVLWPQWPGYPGWPACPGYPRRVGAGPGLSQAKERLTPMFRFPNFSRPHPDGVASGTACSLASIVIAGGDFSLRIRRQIPRLIRAAPKFRPTPGPQGWHAFGGTRRNRSTGHLLQFRSSARGSR